MPRTTRLTSALAGRGKAVAATAAAAAVLAGAGAASAAALTSSAPAAHVADHHSAAVKSAAVAKSAPARTAPSNDTAAKSAAPATAALAAKPAAPAHAAAPAAPAPAAPAAARPAPAAPAAVPAPAAQPAPQPQPYQVYDSVTPSAIPAGAAVATYADGGYAVNPAQVAGHSHVTWIDTSGSDPRAAALDVEPGDATPATAANWTWQKLHAAAGSIAVIYTMRSEWPATQAAIATLPAAMQHQVRWWIADPTGVNHVVPGASATQWYWGSSYDISTAMPGSGL
jgi:hypothetical protein